MHLCQRPCEVRYSPCLSSSSRCSRNLYGAEQQVRPAPQVLAKEISDQMSMGIPMLAPCVRPNKCRDARGHVGFEHDGLLRATFIQKPIDVLLQGAWRKALGTQSARPDSEHAHAARATAEFAPGLHPRSGPAYQTVHAAVHPRQAEGELAIVNPGPGHTQI